jgi:hypothetical protein
MIAFDTNLLVYRSHAGVWERYNMTSQCYTELHENIHGQLLLKQTI